MQPISTVMNQADPESKSILVRRNSSVVRPYEEENYEDDLQAKIQKILVRVAGPRSLGICSRVSTVIAILFLVLVSSLFIAALRLQDEIWCPNLASKKAAVEELDEDLVSIGSCAYEGLKLHFFSIIQLSLLFSQTLFVIGRLAADRQRQIYRDGNFGNRILISLHILGHPISVKLGNGSTEKLVTLSIRSLVEESFETFFPNTEAINGMIYNAKRALQRRQLLAKRLSPDTMEFPDPILRFPVNTLEQKKMWSILRDHINNRLSMITIESHLKNDFGSHEDPGFKLTRVPYIWALTFEGDGHFYSDKVRALLIREDSLKAIGSRTWVPEQIDFEGYHEYYWMRWEILTKSVYTELIIMTCDPKTNDSANINQPKIDPLVVDPLRNSSAPHESEFLIQHYEKEKKMAPCMGRVYLSIPLRTVDESGKPVWVSWKGNN